MIQELKANIEKEMKIAEQLLLFSEEMEKAKADERGLFSNAINSLKDQLKIINSAIPSLLEVKEAKKIKIVRVSEMVSISAQEKERFMRDLGFEKEALKLLKKKIKQKQEVVVLEYYKKPGAFTRISSSLFSKTSMDATRNGFDSLRKDLRKANMPYLLPTYFSMVLFSVLIASLAALAIAAAVFIAFNKILIPIIILIAVPALTLFFAYFYPSSQASSIKGKIDDELPFAVMHMSAVAGSGVEPSKIFRIIALSEEYPVVSNEMKKIINLINFYGYDLSTALRTTAETTSSKVLADILKGISTTITSGGDIKEYLDKIATDVLLDYKLRRKRFSTISETYAEVYTGLLIAAPLMFMLMLVFVNIIGGGFAGMSSTTLAIIGIGALIVINIVFLIFLNLSQPKT